MALDIIELIVSFFIIRYLIHVKTTRVARKKAGFFKSFSEAVPSSRHSFQKQPLSRLQKECPNCAAQVPLAALLCDACDYNFIVSPSQRHKLLSPPTISGTC